jgi:hypothetical protein
MKNNKALPLQSGEDDDPQPVYDFSQGVRGKHHRAFQQGHRVLIHKQDGTIEEHAHQLPDGAVLLDPDVQRYFRDADAVNRALRGLIALIPTPQQS